MTKLSAIPGRGVDLPPTAGYGTLRLRFQRRRRRSLAARGLRMGTRRLFLGAVSLLALTLAACAKEDCGQGGDEDGNGLSNCQDPACQETPACQLGAEICDNNA